MPSFTPVNDVDVNNSSYIVKEFDICKVNKDAVKYTIAALTKSLNFVFKK